MWPFEPNIFQGTRTHAALGSTLSKSFNSCFIFVKGANMNSSKSTIISHSVLPNICVLIKLSYDTNCVCVNRKLGTVESTRCIYELYSCNIGKNTSASSLKLLIK